jgi:predicted  nucleic acid-binding Zn-ribbon protein
MNKYNEDRMDKISRDISELKDAFNNFYTGSSYFQVEMCKFKDEMYIFRDSTGKFQENMEEFQGDVGKFQDDMQAFREEMLFFRKDMYRFKTNTENSFKELFELNRYTGNFFQGHEDRIAILENSR